MTGLYVAHSGLRLAGVGGVFRGGREGNASPEARQSK